MYLLECRWLKSRVGFGCRVCSMCDIHDLLVTLSCTFPVVDTEDDSFLLLWSTQAKQSLLIVSLGVFLEK